MAFPFPGCLALSWRGLDGFTVVFSGLGGAHITKAVKPALMFFTVTRGNIGDKRDEGTSAMVVVVHMGVSMLGQAGLC